VWARLGSRECRQQHQGGIQLNRLLALHKALERNDLDLLARCLKRKDWQMHEMYMETMRNPFHELLQRLSSRGKQLRSKQQAKASLKFASSEDSDN